MSKITVFFLISAVLLISCKKETANNTTSLTIKVIDGRTNAPTAGATVNLFTSYNSVIGTIYKTPLTTDANGTVNITVEAGVSQLYVIVQKNSEWNYYNGLIPVGIFGSTADIANSPVQDPAGVVGGVQFKDTNGDGKIHASDDVLPPVVDITANTTNTINTTIY